MNIIKKYLTNIGPGVLFKKENFISVKNITGNNFNYYSFGNKNKLKTFYVIKRSPGSGFFSNLTFILNHLRISSKFNFIPIIDMQNFTTIYNEKNKIDSTFNAWEYYFEKLNKYNLQDIYKSKNVIVTNSKFQPNMFLDMDEKELHKYFFKLKIKKKFIEKANNFFKSNFKKNDKILGVHFRGSTYKTARGHAFPPTLEIMINKIEKLIINENYNKIMLVTEELEYLEKLKKKF